MQMSPVASRFLQALLPTYGPIHSHLAPVLRELFPLRESTAARAIGSACRCDGQAKSLSLVACSGGIQEGHSIVVNEVREFKVPTVRAPVSVCVRVCVRVRSRACVRACERLRSRPCARVCGACVRACVRACARARACVSACAKLAPVRCVLQPSELAAASEYAPVHDTTAQYGIDAPPPPHPPPPPPIEAAGVLRTHGRRTRTPTIIQHNERRCVRRACPGAGPATARHVCC